MLEVPDFYLVFCLDADEGLLHGQEVFELSVDVVFALVDILELAALEDEFALELSDAVALGDLGFLGIETLACFCCALFLLFACDYSIFVSDHLFQLLYPPHRLTNLFFELPNFSYMCLLYRSEPGTLFAYAILAFEVLLGYCGSFEKSLDSFQLDAHQHILIHQNMIDFGLLLDLWCRRLEIRAGRQEAIGFGTEPRIPSRPITGPLSERSHKLTA